MRKAMLLEKETRNVEIKIYALFKVNEVLKIIFKKKDKRELAELEDTQYKQYKLPKRKQWHLEELSGRAMSYMENQLVIT